MSFDRSDVDVGEHVDRRYSVARSADQAAETPQPHRSADASSAGDIANDTSLRLLPTAEERSEAHRQARQVADETYAAWDRTAVGDVPHPDTTQAETIAEQDKRIAHLETDLGRITTAVSELRTKQDESRPSTEIAERAGGEPTDRSKSQHKRRIPSDVVNNVISIAAGGTITDLAYHIRDLPPEYAGIGATELALGAGIVAVWREHRKADDDADHRPKG